MTTTPHPPDPVPPDLRVALTQLPPIDSSAFWQCLEQSDPTAEIVSPELLAYIIRYFYSQQQTDPAERASVILFLRCSDRAQRIARQNGSKYRVVDITVSVEDIVQEAWQRVFETLQRGHGSPYERRFWFKLGYVVKEQVEAYARKESYTKPINAAALAAGDALDPIHPTNTERIPRGVQTSLTKPLGTSNDGKTSEDTVMKIPSGQAAGAGDGFGSSATW